MGLKMLWYCFHQKTESTEFLSGSVGLGLSVVTAVAWVQCLAWELLHAAGTGKKKKKKWSLHPPSLDSGQACDCLDQQNRTRVLLGTCEAVMPPLVILGHPLWEAKHHEEVRGPETIVLGRLDVHTDHDLLSPQPRGSVHSQTQAWAFPDVQSSLVRLGLRMSTAPDDYNHNNHPTEPSPNSWPAHQGQNKAVVLSCDVWGSFVR